MDIASGVCQRGGGWIPKSVKVYSIEYYRAAFREQQDYHCTPNHQDGSQESDPDFLFSAMK